MKKTVYMLAILFLGIVIIYGCQASGSTKNKQPENSIVYTCLPCGSGCDSLAYTKPGTCRHCNMKLVDRKTIVHKNIQPEEMCLLNEKDVIFLDVRTPEEFNGTAEQKFGAIKNAINIPVQELEQRMNELEKYKDREIIVYCSHSRRSPRASYLLSQKGFKHVTNMNDGMSVWKDQVKDNKCNEKLFQPQ